MPNLMGERERKGGSGRVPDSKREEYIPNVVERYTCPVDLHARLRKFCEEEERAKSWVVQKALEMYLTSKGY